ncbi:hypothetical protein H5410_018755 [Solanum commersonii]|uniref:Uncharacterized protein n=1 Tax=Solanum commersonii TaxID=4109 RepID=A0A9J6A3Q7_SOLCO|nr:hypothetical protein H5410_018755 [Solanum commersonii]
MHDQSLLLSLHHHHPPTPVGIFKISAFFYGEVIDLKNVVFHNSSLHVKPIRIPLYISMVIIFAYLTSMETIKP